MNTRNRWFATAMIGAALFAAGCAPEQPDADDAVAPGPGAPVTAASPAATDGSVATEAGSERQSKNTAERIEDMLEADATLKGFDLDAEEEDNRVVLKGEVKTAAQKTLAEEIARQQAGTATVVSEIRIDD